MASSFLQKKSTTYFLSSPIKWIIKYYVQLQSNRNIKKKKRSSTKRVFSFPQVNSSQGADDGQLVQEPHTPGDQSPIFLLFHS